jgi:bifunctional non-homologous end joining protein LigD
MEYKEVKEITRKISNILVSLNPDRYTLEIRKLKRKGKVFIDFHRNTESQTAIVPYSLRTNEDASIAMPFDWKDINKTLPQTFNIKNYRNHIKLDHWKDYKKSARSIKKIEKKIRNMLD